MSSFENEYKIKDCNNCWKVTFLFGKVSSTFEIDKSLCKTEKELKDYISENYGGIHDE